MERGIDGGTSTRKKDRPPHVALRRVSRGEPPYAGRPRRGPGEVPELRAAERAGAGQAAVNPRRAVDAGGAMIGARREAELRDRLAAAERERDEARAAATRFGLAYSEACAARDRLGAMVSCMCGHSATEHQEFENRGVSWRQQCLADDCLCLAYHIDIIRLRRIARVGMSTR